MTTVLARYNSIGFQGIRGERTFVHLWTPDGEVRAYLTQPAHHKTLSSHRIGNTFRVTLAPPVKNGMVLESDLLEVEPA